MKAKKPAKTSERALHPLSEKLARAGYPAVERHRRKMRTVALLFLGPRFHAGNQAARCAAERAHQTVIRAHSPHASMVRTFFRTDARELQEPFEVARRHPIAVHAGRFAQARRKLDFSAGSEDCPAVVDEKFRKHYYKRNINQRQTHTRVATPRAARLPNRRPHIIAPRGVFRQYVPMELPRQPSRGRPRQSACLVSERA